MGITFQLFIMHFFLIQQINLLMTYYWNHEDDPHLGLDYLWPRKPNSWDRHSWERRKFIQVTASQEDGGLFAVLKNLSAVEFFKDEEAKQNKEIRRRGCGFAISQEWREREMTGKPSLLLPLLVWILALSSNKNLHIYNRTWVSSCLVPSSPSPKSKLLALSYKGKLDNKWKQDLFTFGC